MCFLLLQVRPNSTPHTCFDFESKINIALPFCSRNRELGPKTFSGRRVNKQQKRAYSQIDNFKSKICELEEEKNRLQPAE